VRGDTQACYRDDLAAAIERLRRLEESLGDRASPALLRARSALAARREAVRRLQMLERTSTGWRVLKIALILSVCFASCRENVHPALTFTLFTASTIVAMAALVRLVRLWRDRRVGEEAMAEAKGVIAALEEPRLRIEPLDLADARSRIEQLEGELTASGRSAAV
jgi:hypothetical protein